MPPADHILSDLGERLPRHAALVRRALGLLRPDQRVAGVYLSGSLVTSRGDRFSDIDLNIVARDSADLAALLAEADGLLDQIGQVVLRWGGRESERPWQYLAYYPDMIKLDLVYRAVNQLPVRPGYRFAILYDSTGALADFEERCAGADQPAGAMAGRNVQLEYNTFWAWVYYGAAKVERGELWEAYDSVTALRDTFLLPLYAHLAGHPHDRYRCLEQRWEPHALQALGATISGVEAAGLRRALKACIVLFEPLAQQWADREGMVLNRQGAEATLQGLEALSQGWRR